MKKYLIILLALCVTTALLTTSALAWRSVRTGQKNFERAWSAYLGKMPERADKYFAKAADAFGEALAETPPSRSTLFPSNLAMGGMSLYHAQRYEKCLSAMKKAAVRDSSMWEAPLYTGLSHARLGNRESAVKSLQDYLDSSPSQALLSAEVGKQMQALDLDEVTLQKVADLIDAAALEQFQSNSKYSSRNYPSASEDCSGNRWWRRNKAPCSDKLLYR